MSTEVLAPQGKYRRSIPVSHQTDLDTRVRWLWMQRFGTIQTIWSESEDTFDKVACQLIMQAILERDLESIKIIFQRLEGGAVSDASINEGSVKI